MTISLPGVILRAAERLESTLDAKYLGYPMRQLLDHLRELRADHSKCDEFFALWTDDGKWPAFEEQKASGRSR